MAKWHCAICGYDHVDDGPPPHCPVCGSDRSRFSAVEAAEEKGSGAETLSEEPPTTESQRWQCGVCGYVHTGPEPPQNCPVCGADRSQFDLFEAPPKQPAAAQHSEESAAPDQPPAIDPPAAASLFEPYRRWIDMAIEHHAHPIAVHIPNGVLPVTVVMVLLAGLFDWPAIGKAGVYNMGFIFLSMPLVLLNGYLTWQFKFGGSMTNLFKGKIVCGAIVFLLSLILFAWGLVSPNAAQDPAGMYLLLHLVLLVAAGAAGWLGGKLVFRQ
jgi:rubredoxin/uncharacterized membrane protein